MWTIVVRRVFSTLVALHLLALALCVTWTVLEDPMGFSRTHCAIPNYIPSLSASVTSGLRKRIWIASIGITCSIRIFIHFVYNSNLSYLSNTSKRMEMLLRSHYWLHLIEILALFSLTIYTSKENFAFHRNAFGLFIISCAIFGFLDLLILVDLQKAYPSLAYSIKMKSRFYAIMTVSIFLSAVCYLIHNRYCISHLYSLFALFEHIFILANTAYHYQVIGVIEDLPLKFSGPVTNLYSLDIRL